MIKIAPFEPSRNCTQRRFDYAVQCAESIQQEVYGARDISVRYDPHEDFTVIEWEQGFRTMEPHQCYVKIYKVHSLHVLHEGRDLDLWPCPTMRQLIDYLNGSDIIKRIKGSS